MQVSKSRPLSPHLGIYKPQMSSVLSILHRITGVTSFLGMVAFLWWVVFLTFSAESYTANLVYEFCECLLGKVILMAWTYGLFLHACTGIRHLFWDVGYGFEKSTADITGWLALVSAAILTGITWTIYFNIMGM